MVYPRACGGTGTPSSRGRARTGLSPRVRGNRYSFQSRSSSNGSIPARAGEPISHSTSFRPDTVYPRACRGNRMGNPHDQRHAGSIPARAGEPMTPRSGSAGARVYPRACGGTHENAPARLCRCGLYPRVRGNLLYGRQAVVPPGSIPARAGEPFGSGIRTTSFGVYPRACGGT